MATPSQSARRILGADHPLARVETALAGTRNQAVVCAVLIAGSPVMTGFRICCRGLSFGNESRIAATTRSREKMLLDARAIYCCPFS